MLGIVFSISPLPLIEKDILYFFRAIFLCIASPLSAPPSDVSVSESTLIYHNHPELGVYVRVHSWCCPVFGCNKSIVTCIHHCNMQNIFSALSPLVLFLIFPPELEVGVFITSLCRKSWGS